MDLNIEISASVVAWYAAIVATCGVVISALNYLADRRKLKVKATHGILTGVGDDATKVIISVSNTGKRPVSISSVGFEVLKSGDMILVNTPNLKLPKTLGEGAGAQTWIDHSEFTELLDRESKTVKDVKYVWCRDSTGKVYKSKFKLKW